MSEIRTYKTKISNIPSLKRLLSQKKINFSEGKEVKMYGTVKDASLSFKLDGWRFPIAVKADGTIQYDNWGSNIGSMDRLGEVIQDYNTMVITDEAMMFASNVYSERMKDGNVLLTIQI